MAYRPSDNTQLFLAKFFAANWAGDLHIEANGDWHGQYVTKGKVTLESTMIQITNDGTIQFPLPDTLGKGYPEQDEGAHMLVKMTDSKNDFSDAHIRVDLDPGGNGLEDIYNLDFYYQKSTGKFVADYNGTKYYEDAVIQNGVLMADVRIADYKSLIGDDGVISIGADQSKTMATVDVPMDFLGF